MPNGTATNKQQKMRTTRRFGVNVVGINRRGLSHNFATLAARRNVNFNERNLIDVLAGHGVITSERAHGVSSLSDLSARDYSRFVTRRQLNSALGEYARLSAHEHEVLSVHTMITVGSADPAFRDAIGNLRDELMGDVLGRSFDIGGASFHDGGEVILSSATTAIHAAERSVRAAARFVYRRSAILEKLTRRPNELIAESARTQRMLRALFQLSQAIAEDSTGHTGADLFAQISADWHRDGSTAVPKESRKILDSCLEADGQVLDQLVDSIGSEFTAIVEDSGLQYRRTRITAQERAFMARVALLFQTLRDSRDAERDGGARDISEQEALAETQKLIEEFRAFKNSKTRAVVSRRRPLTIRGKEIRLRKAPPKPTGADFLDTALDHLSHTLSATTDLRAVLAEKEKLEAQRAQVPGVGKEKEVKARQRLEAKISAADQKLQNLQATMAFGVQRAITEIDNFICENKTPHRGILAINILAFAVSIVYITYRTIMVGVAMTALGPIGWIAAALLLAAEGFYACLLIVNLLSNIRLLIKTDGAVGNSHNQKIAKGLAQDPHQRPPLAHLIVTVDESVAATHPNIRSHVISAMQGGSKCAVVIANLVTNPFRQSIKATTKASTSQARHIAARKVIFEKLLEGLGVEAKTAYHLSIAMASEYTEIDDTDCRYFVPARMAGIARDHNIEQRKVKELGRRLAHTVETENADASVYDRFLTTRLTQADVVAELRALRVAPEKVEPVARAIIDDLNRAIDQSRIAKSFHWLIRGAELHQDRLDALAEAMVRQYGITLDAATMIVDTVVTHAARIEDAARHFSAPEAGQVVYDITRNESARDALHRVGRVIDVVARADKRFGLIAEGLEEKLGQIIEHHLYVDEESPHQKKWKTRIPVLKQALGITTAPIKHVLHAGYGHRYSKHLAAALAKEISEMPDFWGRVSYFAQRRLGEEDRGEGGGSYEMAWLEAWDEHARGVRRRVRRVLQSGRFGIRDREIQDSIADAVIANFEENLHYKRLSAEATMQEILGEVTAGQAETTLGVDAIVEDHLGSTRQILVTLMLSEEASRLKGVVGTQVEARVKRIFAEETDPIADHDVIVARLETECRFAPALAEDLVDAYVKIYRRTFLEFRRAVVDIRKAQAGGEAFPVVLGDDAVAGDFLVLPGSGVGIRMSEVKERVDTYVKSANIEYAGGAKGGEASAQIKGGEHTHFIADAWRFAVETIVRERIMDQTDDEVDDKVYRGNVRVSPEITTHIDRKVLSDVPDLLPDWVPAEFKDTDAVVTYFVRTLSQRRSDQSGQFAYTVDEAVDRLAQQMGLFREDFRGRKKVIKRLTFAAEEVAMRLDFTEAFEAVCERQAGRTLTGDKTEVQAILRDVVERRDYGGRNRRVREALEVWADELLRGFDRGYYEPVASQGAYSVRLTPAASRNPRDEAILLRHYSGLLSGYYHADARQYEPYPAMSPPRAPGEDLSDRTRKETDKLLSLRVPAGARRIDDERIFALVANSTLNGGTLDDACKVVYAACDVAEETAFNETFRARLREAVTLMRQDIWMSRSSVVPTLAGALGSGARSGFDTLITPHLGAGNPLTMEKAERDAIVARVGGEFTDLAVKVETGAIVIESTGGRNGRLRLSQGEQVSVRVHHDARELIEDLHRRLIFADGMTAMQAMERLIATSGMPDVTKRREKLATEIRTGAAPIDAAFSARFTDAEDGKEKSVTDKLKEVRDKCAADGMAYDDAVREVTLQAFDLLKVEVDKEVGKSVTKNYLNEKMPVSSPYHYAIIQLDDADYRSYLFAAVDVMQPIVEHPSQFMVGQRQFGRNYRVGGVPLAFHSGGNAYWNQFNKDNTLDSLVPSWGSCVAYAGRAMIETSRWVSREYYTSRLATTLARFGIEYQGKATPSKLYRAAVEKISLEVFERIPKPARLVAPAARVASWLFEKTAVWLIDKAYVFMPMNVLDFLHHFGKRGRLPRLVQWIPDYVFGYDSQFSRVEWALRHVGGWFGREDWWAVSAWAGFEWQVFDRKAFAWKGFSWIGIDQSRGRWIGIDQLRRRSGRFLDSRLREPLRDASLELFGFMHLGGILNLEAETMIELFEQPMDEDVLIKKGNVGRGYFKDVLHELLTVQDTTTESEDIASGLWYLKAVGFFNDEAHIWFVKAFRELFAPKSLYSSSYLEGIGSLGAQPDDLSGANVTFYARWARGNLGIMKDILSTRFGLIRKAKYMTLAGFWMTGFFRNALIASPMLFLMGNATAVSAGAVPTGAIGELFGGLSSSFIMFTPEWFIASVFLNFGLGMSAFFMNMWSAGFLTWKDKWETLGCVGLEWGGLGRMLQSVHEGVGLGERPPFVPSPKEVIYPVRHPMRNLGLEYGWAFLNLTLGLASLDYSFDVLWQLGLRDVPLGGEPYSLAPAAFWNFFHGVLGLSFLHFLNKGVYKEAPYTSALKEWAGGIFIGNYPAHQFYNPKEEKKKRDRERFLKVIEGNFLRSEEGGWQEDALLAAA